MGWRSIVKINNWRELKLTKKSVLFIDIYYYILLVIALALTIRILINTWAYSDVIDQGKIMMYSIYGCIATSVLGCSCYYTRKLYRLKLAGKLCYPKEKSEEELKILGAISYFLSRPLYAMVFSIISIIGIKCGLMSFSLQKVEISASFIEVTMFICFFIGFGTGKFLSLVENKTEDILDKGFEDSSSI